MLERQPILRLFHHHNGSAFVGIFLSNESVLDNLGPFSIL